MPLILKESYTEPGYQPIQPARLSDAAYEEALRRFIPACTDVVPINRDKRLFYLAHRRQKPHQSWWWIGGGMFPDETFEDGAIRCFKRETKVALTADRLTLAAVIDYRWKNRAQVPQDIGCHMIGYTFTAELTEDELAEVARNLDPDEYNADNGLVAFGLDELQRTPSIHPALLAVYDFCFPR